jgi:signal transduction histidine kinase
VDEAYRWQLVLVGTEFAIGANANCLIKGDAERAFEAACNLIENAMKYGDGRRVAIGFAREENCQLITVTNTGNTLPAAETVRLFESFWRGSNASGKPGSGLGLFIARQLAVKMGGDVYAAHRGGEMDVTLVLRLV